MRSAADHGTNRSPSRGDQDLFARLQQAAVRQDPQRDPVELRAIGPGANVEVAVARSRTRPSYPGPEASRRLRLSRLIDHCRLPSRPTRHDSAGAIHDEAAVACPSRRARKRRVERPRPGRAQVARRTVPARGWSAVTTITAPPVETGPATIGCGSVVARLADQARHGRRLRVPPDGYARRHRPGPPFPRSTTAGDSQLP